jgi:hypothetical protein
MARSSTSKHSTAERAKEDYDSVVEILVSELFTSFSCSEVACLEKPLPSEERLVLVARDNYAQ